MILTHNLPAEIDQVQDAETDLDTIVKPPFTEPEITDAEIIQPAEDSTTQPEFKEEAAGKAKLSPTYAKFLETVVNEGSKDSYVTFLNSEIDRIRGGEPVDSTALLTFSNVPRLQAPGRSGYFPKELYPDPTIFIGVGDREARYKAQLLKILNHDRLAGLLGYIAMRKYFYKGGSLAIKPLKNRHARLDFVKILDAFVEEHLVILLHIADQIFGDEMASIRIQQKAIAKEELERQTKISEKINAKPAEVQSTEDAAVVIA